MGCCSRKTGLYPQRRPEPPQDYGMGRSARPQGSRSCRATMYLTLPERTIKVMFGTSRAITFANQIAKIEGYRVEKRFADAVKGLNVYGAKVVRPEALGVLTCQPTA